jgi:GTPase SAR1 family protein
MGICGSSMSAEEQAQAAQSKKLESDLKKTKDIEEAKIKLLLLGAGESGKTTVFKQMKILYGVGITLEERKQITTVVYANVVSSMKTMLTASEELGISGKIAAKGEHQAILNLREDSEIDPTVGAQIKTLWNDAGVQETWARRAEYQIVESVKAYFNDLDRIMAADYIATEQDALLARVRTSGIVEEQYKIDGVDFVMFDVGGQRNERKKWIHCFENVTAVIFVAAISEYNQVLYEDSSANRMDEALELFEEISNSRWFKKSAMILFLNKRDLLMEKIRKHPIKETLSPKYDDFPLDKNFFDPDSPEGDPQVQAYYDTACKYWTNAFLIKYKGDEQKQIYSHCTCATDTNNVQIVFGSCKEVILKGNLQASGFMD